MKHLLLSFLLVIGLGSCDTDNGKQVIELNGYDVREYSIEGCQYLGKVAGDARSNFLTHKGNCNNPIHKTASIGYDSSDWISMPKKY